MKNSDKLFLPLECFFLLSEIGKQFLLTFVLYGGNYNWWYFPFQLCSLPMYLLPVYLYSGRSLTRDRPPSDRSPGMPAGKGSTSLRSSILTFFMTYSLLGGIAVFFDTRGMHYPLVLLTVHSYLWHILLILLGIYSGYLLIQSGQTSWALFWKSTQLYGIFCLVAEFLNLAVSPFGDMNLFYINPLFRMEQVFFCKIADHFGNTAGIISYLLGTIFGSLLLFLAWRTLENRR